MNYSAAIALVSDNVRAVGCLYQNHGTLYVYKTMRDDLEVGDLVVVPSNKGFGYVVVKVEDLDCDFNFEDTTIEYKWVVDKLDVSSHDALKANEQEAIRQLRAADKKKRRDELRQNMLALSAEEITSIEFAREADNEDEK